MIFIKRQTNGLNLKTDMEMLKSYIDLINKNKNTIKIHYYRKVISSHYRFTFNGMISHYVFNLNDEDILFSS